MPNQSKCWKNYFENLNKLFLKINKNSFNFFQKLIGGMKRKQKETEDSKQNKKQKIVQDSDYLIREIQRRDVEV
jgi:hypothetical protein